MFHFQTPQKKDTTVASVHLKVVWSEGEPPHKWETHLKKALQTWFNKNPKNKVTTECVNLTEQKDGSVRLEITPASGKHFFFLIEHEINSNQMCNNER